MLPVSLYCHFWLPLRCSLTFIYLVYAMLPVSLYCHFWLPLRLVYAMLPVSLYCHFWLPLRCSLTFICPVSCVRYVTSLSVLSFLIAPSVFSNVYLSCVLCKLCCQSLCIVIFDCPFGVLQRLFWLPLRYSLTFIYINLYVAPFWTQLMWLRANMPLTFVHNVACIA
jgi:hypothetical protein